MEWSFEIRRLVLLFHAELLDDSSRLEDIVVLVENIRLLKGK